MLSYIIFCPGDIDGKVAFAFSVSTNEFLLCDKLFRNSSKITIHFKDKTLIVQKQSLRLVTVDLLSFVAGSMGLFLGMSCITLLEVFMYLFKSVWGTMNNARYKAYLSKLLGENVSNLLYIEPDMSRSHEQIVITQTMNSEAKLVNSLFKFFCLFPIAADAKVCSL